jgi:hypothetical protein
MYDTGVSLQQLESEVCPYLSPTISFVDPVLRATGFKRIRIGLRGFHCAFKFDLDIRQMSIELSVNMT